MAGVRGRNFAVENRVRRGYRNDSWLPEKNRFKGS